MSAPAADVEALLLAAGQGLRLGLGPKAFVVLGGSTLLERAVATMLAVAGRVSVAVAATDLARAEALVGSGSVKVIIGGARRVETLRLLVRAATAPWLVLHDTAHPLTTIELSRRVIDGARQSGAAAAALPNVDFLFGPDGAVLAAPGSAFAIQKPIAFQRDDLVRGFELAERRAEGEALPDASVLELLALAGRRATRIAGSATNFKLTNSDDLALARRLLEPD
jgi:2-C-methyl-D-erythritol 4-phosphate cytidylyltransferase